MSNDDENDYEDLNNNENASISTYHTRNNNLLADIVLTDAKGLKRIMIAMQLFHSSAASFEFYKEGILVKIIEKGEKVVSHASTLQIPATKIYRYKCNFDILNQENEDEDDDTEKNPFFRLDFQISNFVEFLKTSSAKEEIYFKYKYGSKTVKLSHNETSNSGFDLNVTYQDTQLQFPIEGKISEDDLIPNINVKGNKFASVANSLSKVKAKATYQNYLDFQYDDETQDYGLKVYSSEGKFQEIFNFYNPDNEDIIRFNINFKIMKGFAKLPTVNENGFMSFFFVSTDILRVTIHVGSFGLYHLYIIT